MTCSELAEVCMEYYEGRAVAMTMLDKLSIN
jgi:hypothetical protein